MIKRPAMTTKRKTLLFERYHGTCYLCLGKIHAGEAWDAEHIIPWEISRDDSDANLRPAHKKCHGIKTRDDRRDIAKVHRIAAKHNGSWAKSRTPIRSRGFQTARGQIWQPVEAEDPE